MPVAFSPYFVYSFIHPSRGRCQAQSILEVTYPVLAGRLNRLRLADRCPVGALRPSLRASSLTPLSTGWTGLDWTVHTSAPHSLHSTHPPSFLPPTLTLSCVRSLPPSPHSLHPLCAFCTTSRLPGKPLLELGQRHAPARNPYHYQTTQTLTTAPSARLVLTHLCRVIPVPRHPFRTAYLACTTLHSQCEYSPQLPASIELPRSLCLTSPHLACLPVHVTSYPIPLPPIRGTSIANRRQIIHQVPDPTTRVHTLDCLDYQLPGYIYKAHSGREQPLQFLPWTLKVPKAPWGLQVVVCTLLIDVARPS